VLRIGIYELLWADDVPDGVAISEAVLLARDLSTDASPAFINGLLARIADLKPSLKLDSEPSPEPESSPDLAPSGDLDAAGDRATVPDTAPEP
jgi:hypothetical protein